MEGTPEAATSPWPIDKVILVQGLQAQRAHQCDTLLQRSQDFGDSVAPTPDLSPADIPDFGLTMFGQASPCTPGMRNVVAGVEQMEVTSEVPTVPTSPAGIDADDKEPDPKRGRSAQP